VSIQRGLRARCGGRIVKMEDHGRKVGDRQGTTKKTRGGKRRKRKGGGERKKKEAYRSGCLVQLEIIVSSLLPPRFMILPDRS